MIMTVIKFLLGGGITSIGEQINKSIEIRETAKNNETRIQADENIARLRAVRDLEVQRLIARSKEKPNIVTKIIRIILAVPIMLVVLKMCADYIAKGVVNPVPDQLWWIVGLVLAWAFWGPMPTKKK